MKYLFDTKPFLLWASASNTLPAAVLTLMKSSEDQVYLSLASMREMQLKSQMGLLDLGHRLLDVLIQQRDVNRIKLLPIDIELTVMLQKLPNIHHDPFDRLIVAQALAENMTVITDDPLLKQYDIKTLWDY